MSRLNKGDPDRKYYNVAIANNEKKNGYTYAFYKNVLNQSLIDDPSKYYLSVLRFQMPTADIPILIPEIASFGPDNPIGDVNKTVYSVTLTSNGETSGQIFVEFISIVPNSTPRAITIDDPNPMVNPSDYYFIYNYRHFIDLVNTAFETAFTNLNNNLISQAKPIIPGVAPFITYNGQTYLMTLHASPQFLYSTNPLSSKIYMNYKLFTFFDGIEFIFLDYLSQFGIEIQIKDYNGTNFDGTNYLMSQQYPSLSNWNIFKSVQIVSSFLPVEVETVPIPSYQDQNILNTLSVVKDFVPFYENGPEFRSFINFSYSGSYELINLNSNIPISVIDISVYWLDRYGNRYLLSIPYNQVLTIKFVFIKKDTFVG